MAKPARSVTITTIANAVGVSPKTVSLALRGDRQVSPKTAKAIRETAANLGYHRYQQLAPLIGVITPHIAHSFYAELLHWLQEVATRGGYSLHFRETDFKMVDELSAIQELDQARVHGIILLNPTSPLARLQPLIHPTRPIVAIVNADWPSQPGFSCLGTDNIDGMRQALQHVLELRHRRIAYFSGPAGPASRRRRTFAETLESIGIFNHRYLIDIGAGGPATYEHGYSSCLRLFELAPTKEDMPTAILAFNDVVALGALRALKDRKVLVPEEMSVVGFDDLDFAAFTTPRLSTVAVPRRQLATDAMERLIKLIEAGPESDTPAPSVLATTFIKRNSTGPSPAMN